MKTSHVFPALALLFGLALSAAALAAEKQQAQPNLKIGVYDSRVVALAYYRSTGQMARLSRIHEEYNKAKADNNKKRIQELEKEGPWNQVRMHQQVFSTAGIAHITAQIADEIKTIARESGVIAVVSRWEMPYLGADVATVDLTLAMAKLFDPDEKTMKIMESMKNQAPVPFDKLSLDPTL